MAKYNVTYKCGHEDRVELFGKMSVREWRLEQMAGELCPECQRKAEMERLRKQEAEDGLPSLTGSEKQIAWAMKLRDDALNSLRMTGQRVEVEIQTCQKKGKNDDSLKLLKEYINTTMLYLSEQTESKFFIDRRDEFKYIGMQFYHFLSESGINEYLTKYEKYKQENTTKLMMYVLWLQNKSRKKKNRRKWKKRNLLR